MKRKRVGIVLFEDIEVLDFCGPFEVFSATRLNEPSRREEPSPFEVLLVAESPGPVITTGGMTVLPHFTFENCPRLDVVVVPGGWGTRRELHNPVLLDSLRRRAAEAETVTAVCTGSMLLGFAGRPVCRGVGGRGRNGFGESGSHPASSHNERVDQGLDSHRPVKEA